MAGNPFKKKNSVEKEMSYNTTIRPYYCKEGITRKKHLKKIIAILIIAIPIIAATISGTDMPMSILGYVIPALIFSSTLLPNPTIMPEPESIVKGLIEKGVTIEGWSCYNYRFPLILKTSDERLITIENRGIIRIIVTNASKHLPAPPSSRQKARIKILEKKEKITYARIDTVLINRILRCKIDMSSPSLYNPSVTTKYIGEAVIMEAKIRSKDTVKLIELIMLALKAYNEGINAIRNIVVKSSNKKKSRGHISIHFPLR